MAEKKTTILSSKEILTEANIKKEFNAIKKMFNPPKNSKTPLLEPMDPDKMKLIERIIEEVAFQKVAMKAAKADMILNGLQTTTKNASQKFVKENPAVQTYDKYARAYTSNMKTLIDMLPPKQQKEVSLLMQLRGDD